MPKDIIVTKRDNRVFRAKPGRKFKVGGRKSGKSGYTMATSALQAVLDDSGKSRYHANARTVLASRGVEV